MNAKYIALLSAILIEPAAKRDVQILPAGQFKARDGRPGPGQYWRISDEQGVKLAADMTSIAAQSAFNFDYEHQTLNALSNGQPAPASGWASKFEWRPGQGLYALNVDWTDRAAQMIDAKEYRYISPLIAYDKDNNVTGVLNAALVNTPAILGMESVIAGLQVQLNQPSPATPNKSESNVNLLQMLIAALALKADANESEALAAVAALKARADAQPMIPQPLAAALAIKADAELSVAVSAIQALKTGDDTAKTTIAALQTQVAQLQTANDQRELQTVIAQGLKDGKLIPATQQWAEDLGKRDLAALKTFIQSAPQYPLGALQSGGQDPGNGGGQAALSGLAADVAAHMGLTPAQFNAAAA